MTTTAPDSNATAPAVVPAPTTLEQVVTNSLWNLPIPIPPGEAEPANPKDYKELHKAKVALLKKRLANLPTVTDEKTLDVNQKALTALVKVRTGLNKARQGMFESVKKLKEDVDRYVGTTAENGLQAEIKALETPIEEAIQGYRDELERKRQEAERVLEQRNNDRIAYILAGGMIFDGQKYSLGDLILWPVDLRNFGEPEWMGWIDKKLKPAVKLAEEAKAEEEAAFAKAQAEKEQKDREMRELFEKQQADQKRMDEERAELDRQRAQMRIDKNNLRADELRVLGAESMFEVDDVADQEQQLGVPVYSLLVSTLADIKDEDWPATKQRMREEVVIHREMLKENQRKNALMDERSLVLRALPRHRYDGDSVWTLGEAVATDHQLANFTSDEWAACLRNFKEENARALLAEMAPMEPAPEPVADAPFTEERLVAPPPGTYAPLRVSNPAPDPDEIRRLEGAVLELEAAMVSCGSSAEHTSVEAHRLFFLKAEASCRMLHGQASEYLNAYRDGQAQG